MHGTSAADNGNTLTLIPAAKTSEEYVEPEEDSEDDGDGGDESDEEGEESAEVLEKQSE